MTTIEEVCGLLEGYPDVPRKRLEGIISYQTKIVQKLTGLSFSGVTQYTELHDGTGHEELMLDRRPVSSLDDIQVLSWPYTNYTISPSSIQVIGDMGMLRVRNLYDVGFQPVAPCFPKGRMNIKVTYTAGFAAPPDDVQTAIALLTFADALGQVAGIRGDATSLSVEGWSKSYGNPRGRYGNVRADAAMRARALLRSYTSSVVGP